MDIPQSFVKKNCPCVRNHPCQRRGPECKAECAAWAEWIKIREEERARLVCEATPDRYVAAGASATISRSTHFRAMKRERGIK